MTTLLKAAVFSLMILSTALATGLINTNHAQAQNIALSHEQALASLQPGLDQDAAQTVLNWWSALFAQNSRELTRLSGNPIILNGQPMTRDTVMQQFQSANAVISEQGDWPIALLAIDVRPAVDPVTGTTDYKIDNKLQLQVTPDDRVVGLTMVEKNPDGSTRGMATVIHHYAQHLHTSQFRIVGLGD